MNRTFLVITGPTGVGKTEYIEHITHKMSIEVINADIGQMYTPLTIGTAKPDWRNAQVPHHLFDILDEPRDCTVAEYRKRVVSTLEDIWRRGSTPVLVGGSLFYIHSLFFPPSYIPSASNMNIPDHGHVSLWNQLYSIDPDRAHAVHPHDIYRIKRALAIWYATGEQPSSFRPQFHPPGNAVLTFLTRDRSELYARINSRTHTMLQSGWIDEVASLPPEWKTFVKDKHILGYPEIVMYCNGEISYEEMVSRIQKQTCAYAKRQETFWRSMHRKVSYGYAHDSSYWGRVMTLSLSDGTPKTYADHIYYAIHGDDGGI